MAIASTSLATEAWEHLLKTQLVESGFIMKACILGKQDANLWASTSNFFEPEKNGSSFLKERKRFLQISNGMNLYDNITVLNEKYIVIRVDESIDHLTMIYGRGKNIQHLCIGITKQCIVLAIGNDLQPGNMNSLILALSNYLIENEF